MDFTTGYSRSGRWLSDWRGRAFRPVRECCQQALSLVGAQDAAWIYTQGDFTADVQPPALALVTDFDPARPTTVTRQVDPAAVSFVIPDSATTVRIGPDWMTRSGPAGTTTWRIASSGIPAPSGVVVDARDIDSARSSVQALRWARAAIQSARDSRSVKQLRRTVKNKAVAFPTRNIAGGVALFTHDRYLNRVWRLRWNASASKVRVQTIDRHPSRWSPPRRTVTIEPAHEARTVGRDAAVLLDRAAIWTQQQPGVLITANRSVDGADDGPRRVSLDYERGLTGLLNEDGTSIQVRNPSGLRECYLLSPITPRLRRALQVAGRPNAAWACSGEGDTDLAWAPSAGPVGIASVSLNPHMLFNPSIRLTHDGENTILFGANARGGSTTLEFAGTRMTSARSSEPDEPDLGFRYDYGPQHLRMPPMAARVSDHRLRDATESLGAQRSVRLTSAAVRTCASKRIDRGLAPLLAIRKCALRIGSRGVAPVLSNDVPAGVRLYLRNQFGLDSRDVVVSSDGTRAVVTRIIHRR